MVSQFKFAKWLQTQLDNQDVLSDVVFKVRNNDIPFVDTIANKVDNTNDSQRMVLPVLVEKMPNGGYEPYPNLLLWDCAFNITFMFPLADLESIEEIYGYLAKICNGKTISNSLLGLDAHNVVVMAMGQTSYSAMQSLDMGQFSQIAESVKAVFGKEIRMTREWCTMSFEISCSGTDSDKKIIYGNSLYYQLYFTYNNAIYSDRLTIVQTSNNFSVDTFSQQRINSGVTKSLPTITANGVSIDFVVAYESGTSTSLQSTLLGAYYSGNISSITDIGFTIGGDRILFNKHNLMISNIGFSFTYGGALVCSLSLVEKDEVKSI